MLSVQAAAMIMAPPADPQSVSKCEMPFDPVCAGVVGTRQVRLERLPRSQSLEILGVWQWPPQVRVTVSKSMQMVCLCVQVCVPLNLDARACASVCNLTVGSVRSFPASAQKP